MKVHLNRSGQMLGQFEAEQVWTGFQQGVFRATDLAWRDGMERWRPLGEIVASFAPAEAKPDLDYAFATAARAEMFPWERPDRRGLVRPLIATFWSLLTSPVKTFRAMPLSGGLVAPLLFFVLLATTGVTIALGLQVGLAALGSQSHTAGFQVLVAVVLSVAFVVVCVVLLPIAFVALIFVLSGLTHAALAILGGGKGSFEATFRVTCYAAGTSSVLHIIPVCGGIVAWIWNIVLTAIGLSQAHQISMPRASVAVIVPYLTCCTLTFGAMMVPAALVVTALEEISTISPFDMEKDERGQSRRLHEYFGEQRWVADPHFRSTTDDVLAYWMLQSQRFTYDYEKIKSLDPTWQSVPFTWQSQRGVCRDSATLLADMLRAQGYDARLVVGDCVDGPGGVPGPGTGHAWVVLRDGSSGDEYLLESTSETIDLPVRYPPRTFFCLEYLPEMQITDAAYYVPSNQKGGNVYTTDYTKDWDLVPTETVSH